MNCSPCLPLRKKSDRLIFFTILLLLNITCSVPAQNKNDFLWGVASASYQVEGAYQSDGKGESTWDFLTNKVGVTQFMIGEKQTGNVVFGLIYVDFNTQQRTTKKSFYTYQSIIKEQKK